MHSQTCRSPLLVIVVFLALTGSGFAQDLDWDSFVDPEYGNRYEIPTGMFEQVESDAGKLVFEEVDEGGARLMIYSGDVPSGMTLGQFEERVRAAEWIEDVTYRVAEGSWFVLSGYYRTTNERDQPFIFYTKFMLSPDRERYAAIEVTYQVGRKREFDPIVTRLEKGLRPPS
jgi:hypothetical protein